MPQARSRISEPVGEIQLGDGVPAPTAVEPERDHPVHAVVPGRDAVEHPLDGAALLVALGERTVTSEDGHHDSARSQPGSLHARRELGRVADRFEMLLCDLEQHAPKVVRDERGDGGQQRAERFDETLRLLGLVELRRLERATDVLVEHLDRVAGDRAGPLVVTASEREQVVEREAGLEQAQPGTQHVDVVERVAGTPVALLRERAALRARSPRPAARGSPTRAARSSRPSSSASPCWAPATAAASGTSVASSSPSRMRRITASENPCRWSSLIRPSRSSWSVSYQPTRPSRRGGGAAGASGRSGWCRRTRRRGGRAPPLGWRRRPLP